MSTKEPERTCIACKRKGLQHSFVRIRKSESDWVLDSKIGTGRSIYLCPDRSCIENALKGDRISRGLRQIITRIEIEQLIEALTCKQR